MAFTFSGGVHPNDGKSISKNCPITEMALPPEVILPVRQHIGAPSNIVVQKGDKVKKGQIIAEAAGFVSSPVHSSISGTVKAIENRSTPVGIKTQAVIIESDGEDVWADGLNEQRDYSDYSPEQLRDIIKASGIVGLGGAAFPTHVKLSPPADKPIDTIILNGVECEPYATCDHRLMIENPDKIIEGLKIIMKVLGCTKAFIGIELNKPDAISVMRDNLKSEPNIKIAKLHVKYPQGGEKQLIYAVTKRKVPAGGLPMDVGCVVQNVATAKAIYDAVALNRPLIERVVTVTGNGIKNPSNIKARLGDTFKRLIEFSGNFNDDASKLIMGGPMMGIAQYTDDVPVIKGTSCILALNDDSIDSSPEYPCISCSRCVEVCPMNLIPTALARNVELERWEELNKEPVTDCIECGSCTYICPAKRKIVERIKYGKAKVMQMRLKEKANKKI